jgi:hypothetical protein
VDELKYRPFEEEEGEVGFRNGDMDVAFGKLRVGGKVEHAVELGWSAPLLDRLISSKSYALSRS